MIIERNALAEFKESERVRIVALLLGDGGEMRRDDDLIRKLMLDMEANPEPIHICSLTLDTTLEDRLVYYHMRLLSDEGFLEESGRSGGAFRMTNKGHDFVGAVRTDTAWNRTKAIAAKASADVSLSMLKDIAIGALRQELTKLGIPLG